VAATPKSAEAAKPGEAGMPCETVAPGAVGPVKVAVAMIPAMVPAAAPAAIVKIERAIDRVVVRVSGSAIIRLHRASG
jgi:hypothetical protein